MERITKLRNRVKGREGVVGHVKATLRDYWENCAAFRVVEVEINGNEFIVRRGTTSAAESERVYNLDVSERTCMCGEWQDQGYPCIDAIAYFRLHKKMTLNSILTSYVDKLLTYETEYEMLKANIYPVCIETISPDGSTLPPDASKRRSGRPRRKRIRKRPHSACDPEESPIVCGKCHRRGHNSRTCVARRENERIDNEEEVEMNNEDGTGVGSSHEVDHGSDTGKSSEVDEAEVTDDDETVEGSSNKDDQEREIGNSGEVEEGEVTESDNVGKSEDGSSNEGNETAVGSSNDIGETELMT
jgi:hypothetical protein